MVGAVIGGLLSGKVPGNALLVVIGATLFVFGVDLLRSKPSGRQSNSGGFSARSAIVTGALIGVLGGFVGLILGALRLPALLRFVGAEPFRAVGTNAAVGFCLGVAGIFGHLPGGVDWTLLGVGAATSVPGAVLGARFTGRLDERQLFRAAGLVLLVAGTAMILQGIF
jgi:uncharacterized membrane protein YfcA